MRIMKRTYFTRLAPVILIACMTTPALAQRDNQSRDQQNQSQPNPSQTRDGQKSRSSSRQDGSQSQLRVQPEGWVRMAVDYDNDGTYDAIETIYVYDLQMAKQRSEGRRNQGDRSQGEQRMSSRQQSSPQQQRDQGDRRSMQASQDKQQKEQVHQLSGEIRDTKKIRMHEGNKQFIIARIRTDEDRTARVLLGSEEQLSRLDIQDGDRIDVRGRRGRVNDQWVLVADSVKSGNNQIRVQFEMKNKPIRRYQGEVLQTRTTRFRGHDGEFLIAQLQCDDGQTKVVNLGPKEKFSDMNIRDANEVSLLATPGKVNGREALIAEQVSVDGQTVKIKPDERREQRWSTSGSNQQSQDQQDRRYENSRRDL